jgi:hypothetical protein
MPAHSSHLLQPLDIGCFGVIKRAYSKVIEAQAKLHRVRVGKIDFLEAYQAARNEAFKPETIVNSFASTCLVPFNPERVLSKLNIRLTTPPRPTSQGSYKSNSSKDFTPRTPHTIKDVRRQAASIRKLAKEQSQRLDDAIDQLERGFNLALHNYTIEHQQSQELLAANAKVTRKKARTKARIAYEGGLLVEEAISRFGAEREVEEARSDQAGEASPMPNPTNKRRAPQCSRCKTPGHKRNRCTERSE